MDFKEKYLKYKSKYIALKNQIGSGYKFIEAIKKGDIELVQKKLTEEHGIKNKHKSDPNQIDFFSKLSALEIAINYNHVKIVELLLKYGAKINKNTIKQALIKGNVDILKLLSDYGADYDKNVFKDAIHLNRVEIFKVLLENSKNNIDPEIMWTAILWNNLEITKLLLEHGEKLDSKSLKLIRTKGNSFNFSDTKTSDIIKLLIKYNAITKDEGMQLLSNLEKKN